MSPDSPWLHAVVVLACGLVVHQAVLGGLRIAGVRPDLLLGMGIVAALVGTPEGGAVVAFGAGVLADLFVSTPFGLSALVGALVAYAAGTVAQGVGGHHRWSVPALTGVASAVAVVAWAGLGTVLGLPGLLTPRLGVIAVVVAGVNVVCSFALAPVMRWVFAGMPGAVSNAGSASAPRGFLT